MSRAEDISWLARGDKRAAEELEWLLEIARELSGSPEVTVTFARGSIFASARLVLAGVEAAGIGADAGERAVRHVRGA